MFTRKRATNGDAFLDLRTVKMVEDRTRITRAATTATTTTTTTTAAAATTTTIILIYVLQTKRKQTFVE